MVPGGILQVKPHGIDGEEAVLWLPGAGVAAEREVFPGRGGQGGEPGDTCAHDAMFRMTAVMAGSAEER